VSSATVKTHVNRIFAKTGARDRAQAVRYACERAIS
jgi:DNA-binding NarL/FixJ family response regulator